MLTRRQALAAGAGLCTAAAANGISVALAGAATERRLVVVVLRGALDGLAAVPPYFDREYRRLRGPLAMADNGTADGMLDLDGRFGLHPALKPLHALYQRGEMSVIHAVATPYRARSHFDAQDLLENGSTAPRGLKDGWLNRAIGLIGTRNPSERLGLAVGAGVPLLLRGEVPVGSWAPPEMPAIDGDFLTRLAALYAGDALLGPAIDEGLRAQAMTDDVLGHRQGAMSAERMYGRARPPLQLRTVAGPVGRLLAATAGPRIAVLEMGGWDTHAAQGVLNGRLAFALQGLGEGLAELHNALGAAWRETAVVVVTEFGRTVATNGTGGTDHGTGGAAFVLGGALPGGGRVITHWPGLNNLYEGRDLAPTLDLRSVMKALLIDHMGLPVDGVERVVFPQSTDAPTLRDLRA